MAHKYSASDYVFQFITIMAGVLIAMLANGMVERSRDRELVATARLMLAREIADNRKELEGLPQVIEKAGQEVEVALTLVSDLLKTGKSSINSLELNFNLATLNESSWQSADRTGALAHMNYEEVKEYSELYAMQKLFVDQQRKAIDLVSAAIAPSFDPTSAERPELVRFREQLALLQANLIVVRQFGAQLMKGYEGFLQREIQTAR